MFSYMHRFKIHLKYDDNEEEDIGCSSELFEQETRQKCDEIVFPGTGDKNKAKMKQ